MLNRQIEQDLTINFSVRGWTGFERKWTDMPLGVCRKYSKACRGWPQSSLRRVKLK